MGEVYGRNFWDRSSKSWRRVVVSQEDFDRIQESLRAVNMRIFGEAIRDAQEVLKSDNRRTTMPQILSVARELFNARRLHAWTVLDLFTKRRVEEARNGNNNGNGEAHEEEMAC